MLLLLLHHQVQREPDAVTDVDSLAVAVCCEEGVVDSGDDARGGEGRVCCEEGVVDPDCGAELDALCYGERVNGGDGA